jgi:RimJ/RimL family protein N-acetyltransferase
LSAPEGADTIRLQHFVADNGMAPLPGSLLVEAPGQATAILVDGDERPVAVATAYFAHNVHSPYHRNAWIGMVTVDQRMRGNGVGRYVNALAIRRAIENLGAERVNELVSSTNAPSRRMVQACGLAPEPGLVVGVSVPADADRFTR